MIDLIKLAANNLTIKEVEAAMRGENISLPAGTLEADNIDLTLNLDKSYNDINSIKQLPIKTDNKVILLLITKLNSALFQKNLLKLKQKIK